MISLLRSRRGFLPLGAVVLLVVVGILIVAYIATPPELKLLIPITVVAFILGVILVKIPALMSALFGGIYWLMLEAANQLNIMDNPVASFIFGPFVILAIVGFLVGRTLGTYILG